LRARSDYLGDKDVNKRGSTLRLSDLLFFGVVQSDLRHSKAYCHCLGMCQSSTSPVCFEKFQKNLLSRLRGVDVGIPAKYYGLQDELIRALSQTVKIHLNSACRCNLSSFHQEWIDLKLVESRLRHSSQGQTLGYRESTRFQVPDL